MYDSNSKGISYSAGFFILIAFAVAGIIIGTLVSIPIWMGMTGRSLEAMKDEMGNPNYSGAFKMIQAISSICGFLLPTLVTASLLNRKPYKLTGFTRKINITQFLLVLGIMFVGLYAAGAFGYLNQQIPVPAGWKPFFQKLETDYNKQVNAIMQVKSFGDYIVGLLIMALLPAICEETLFRGGLQNYMTRATKLPWLSIIVVSILFSLVHLSYYGFLVRLFLGIILGLIYQYTGSIWLCILAHFANNAMAVSEFYFGSGKLTKEVATETVSSNMLYIGLAAIPVLIILIAVLKRNSPPPDDDGNQFSLEDMQNKPPWEIG